MLEDSPLHAVKVAQRYCLGLHLWAETRAESQGIAVQCRAGALAHMAGTVQAVPIQCISFAMHGEYGSRYVTLEATPYL